MSGSLEAKLMVINQMISSQSALMGINDIILTSGQLMLLLIPFVFLARKSNKLVKGGGH
ncbi:MAG: hypothetical protein RLZZ210_899 [Pseudomonadota bacterium]|jgi:DHA2 family multidrug resistance protein